MKISYQKKDTNSKAAYINKKKSNLNIENKTT